MASPDSNARARAELVDLIESQLNTLKKETFGVVFAEFCLCFLMPASPLLS